MQADKSETPSYEYTTYPKRFISYRWFKPILVALLTFVFMVIFQIVLLFAVTVWTGDINFISTLGTGYDDMNPYTGPGALIEFGGIAALLPALALSALIVRDRPYSSYTSSRGGWNWSAFFKCLCVAAVIFIILSIVQVKLTPEEEMDGVIRFTAAGIIACLILIPLQCAAEEYIFRGLIMQAVGSWTKIPAIAIIVSAAAFAAGHPYNLIGVITIFLDGVIWGVVAWRSRGLEATCAVHIVNNMVAFFLSGMGLQTVTSTVDITSMVFAITIDVVYAAAVLLLGKKFNWFYSTGDTTIEFNEKSRAKLAEKEVRKHSDLPVPPKPDKTS